MLDAAYVVTWRYSDGSGSGATAVFTDRARAEVLVNMLSADTAGRNYKIEPVPFDNTEPLAHLAARTPIGGAE